LTVKTKNCIIPLERRNKMKSLSKFANAFSKKENSNLITPFDMKVLTRNLEEKGKEIIHLEIGEPDFDTPENIKSAGINAIKQGFTHYAPSQGLPDLIDAVVRYISETRKIPVSKDEVIIVPGGKNIIFYTMMALLNEGDEVIIPDPGYYPYRTDAKLFGAKVVPLPLLEEKNFSFDYEKLKSLVNKRTKLLVLISPANPTGNLFSQRDLEFIADLAKENDIYVLSDEIYSRIVYEGEFHSIAEIPGMKERTIILDGFSKTYAMTGWRLGYGIANKEITRIFNKLLVSSNSCTATFTQIAGIEALTGNQQAVDKMVGEYKRRRNFIYDAINKINGASAKLPNGAFYLFVNIKKTGMSSNEFVLYLLNNFGVATIPGSTFGQFGEGYIRISYANSMENLKKAVEQIRKAIESI
jgi:aspartate aminotransferase